jgi:hypothetical protein
MTGGLGNDEFLVATGNKTIRDFNIGAGETDVANVRQIFDTLDQVQKAATILKIDSVMSTRIAFIDTLGQVSKLDLIGYDITKDANVAAHFDTRH